MYMYVYIISFHNDMQSGFRNIRIQLSLVIVDLIVSFFFNFLFVLMTFWLLDCLKTFWSDEKQGNITLTQF